MTATDLPLPRASLLGGKWRALATFVGASWLNGLAILIVVGVVMLALIGQEIAPFKPDHISLGERLSPPSALHLFGTDHLGRDLFSRVLAGARISMLASSVVLIAAVVVGTIAGIVAGVAGGWVDEGIMRLTDLFLAFP